MHTLGDTAQEVPEFDAEEARNLLLDNRTQASPLQIAHFVLEANSAGTWWGVYVQALRELQSHMETIKLALIEHERLRRNIDRLDARDPDFDLDRAKKQIEYEASEKAIRTTYQQAQVYLAHASHARAQLPEKITPGVRHMLDEQFWTATISKQALLEHMCQRPTSQETFKAISVLPPHMAKAVLGYVYDPGNRSMEDFKLTLPVFKERPLEELPVIQSVLENAMLPC